jgi:glucose-1-phosphate adenylyltransferase
MALTDRVLALILGGGQGSRLFPLTLYRSKPAVPIGGKYRLIDIPVSNCLHAGIRRIFVLTQFNSASLNRHIAMTYRLDPFHQGFVEVLAAEQTPDNPNWYQGTADAVRQAQRHFIRHPADYYLILAGDQLYRMDFNQLLQAHVESRADITLAALPVTPEDAASMGIFRFDAQGRITAFEEKPNAERLGQIGQSVPQGATFTQQTPNKPFVASMGVYVFSRDVLLEILNRDAAKDFGREIIPGALERYSVQSFVFPGYWADVGTVESFFEANILLTQSGAPVIFNDPFQPIYTEPRFLPASNVNECTLRDVIIGDGCSIGGSIIERSVIGIRTQIQPGAKISRSVLLGADFYEMNASKPADSMRPSLGIGRDVVLDRVIVDKNARVGDGARLLNTRNQQHCDGEGYYIRNGIIIVPKDGVVPENTAV